MKYKVVKTDYDGRIFTHGVIMPDGFYRVISLTRKNFKNLQSLSDRGYMLTELPDDDGTVCGLYEEGSDRLVDPQSAFYFAAPRLPGDATEYKVKYIQQKDYKTYKDDLQWLGMSKADKRKLKRESRMSKAQLEFMQSKKQVDKSRNDGLSEVAGMMGISGSIGVVEDQVRERLGS